MTFNKIISLAFVATTVFVTQAHANHSIPGPRPVPAMNQQIQKSVRLNTRVVNSTFDLLQSVGIDNRYIGYKVDSVVIESRGTLQGTQVGLLVNGYAVSSVFSPIGIFELRPQGAGILGRDIFQLHLAVRGVLDIAGITVNLSSTLSPPPPPPPPVPAPVVTTMDLGISVRLFGHSQLDISRFIDMNQYRGYRIQAIEIETAALNGTSLLDLSINGRHQGATRQVDARRQLVVMNPKSAILGQGAEQIFLETNGDVDIYRVTMRLSR